MYPLLATFIRYSLIALASFLASKGFFDSSVIEPLAGAGVALFAVTWFLITREKPPHDDGGGA